ncbi:tetratricopeptide repeat protein [Promethearchaeum syntrophicum]|uniref:Tetratricopeptide repeat protein n=1 Tax=Promethearchaeum syntrophicum TaxID=2594042 RepID=A0A5B9D7R6_9ARCH|nr:tetratricopeptide repeat protein [Candidatus Prometheoarchaeum syntrophicum]QEE15142.1 Tetratricopeptide repeat protein [Candidatus Prometheoarchaeum syntrophicum]
MIYDLYNFLTSKRFVELLDWVENIIENYDHILSEKQKIILGLIQKKEIQNLIKFLKKESFTAINNELYNLILEELEKNKEEISTQWNFIQKFDLKAPFVNIILDNDIIVFQGNNKDESEKLENLKDLEEFLKDPNKILAEGKVYCSKGLSSIDKIQGIMTETNFQQEFVTYQKYEKIVQFIEGLNLSLQKLFSMNQIGVIIFKNEIYLIRWVQFLDESQLISGTESRKSNVEIMEDFGVKIGIQLKENLELGNLVIFKNRRDKNEQDSILRTLFSLDQDFFQSSRRKRKKKKYDLKLKEDCEEFVNEVLSRIESGILMLNNKNFTQIRNSKDLKIYVKISLQRIEGIDTVNQRINILRDLLNLDTDPVLKTQIIEKLEDNYCIFLKEQFKLGNVGNVPSILKIISKLDLFSKRKSLLIHTMVYLFDSYYSNSETIISSVDLIIKYWNPSNELIKVLEKPQVVAITNKIIEQMRLQNFAKIWSYITKYLEEHPYFRSYNIFTLMLEILIEIYHKREGSRDISFPNTKYLTFFREFIVILKSHKEKFEKSEMKDLIKKFREKIQALSNNLDFIAYLNNKIIDFLTFLSMIDKKILSERIFYKILYQFAENGSLVMFYKRLPKVGEHIFRFLTLNYKNTEMTLEFCVNYVEIFTNSVKLFQEYPAFFKNATKTLNEIKPWLNKESLQPILLLSIKKKIKILLNQWYLSGNLPENEFETHKHIIDTWIDFVEYRENLQNMLNILHIKDFIWSCEHFNLEEMKKKYLELPHFVFEMNGEKLFNEMKKILNKIFEDYIQFQIFQQVFSFLQEDIKKLNLSKRNIKKILEIYNKTLRIALINIVQKGYSHKFKNIISNLGEDIVLCNKRIFEEIYQHFIAIYELNIQEGERFNLRIEMMKNTSLFIEKIIPNYEKIIEVKTKLLEIRDIFLPKTFLVKYLADLKQGTYSVFQETQKWLIQMSPTNYLTYKSTFKPLKLLFENILEQNSEDKQNLENILIELKHLSKTLFENQRMLGENKKKYFLMMKNICSEEKYPELMKITAIYLEFIEELADIESLYYNISADPTKKIDTIMERTLKITKQYPHFFSPWFILANSYAIKENYPKAIEAYEKALKYDSNQANYARMYNNLLVVYLSQKMFKETISLIKNLDIGIKTFPHISEIIRRVEELTGEHLLGEN